MNHCLIGGVGDGDSGEDGGDEQRGAWAATAVPRRRHHGGAPPLSPFLYGFMGALPMEMGSMGEAETWLWWLQIRGWRCPPRARVPPFI
jgi:hypothetical protein